ncbi:MAG: hypothetical protein P1U61_00705 [Legionellaceae bacterium]|nr:hypothetical protein [Legionellaceae bacterium]
MELIINASKQTDVAPISSMAEVRLLKAFGYADNALPVAELLARYHKLSGVWAVLSPIHWETTHNDALMMLGDASRDLFEAFQAFLAEDNMQLYYHDVNTWLLRCDAHPFPKTKPLHAVLQHSMRPLLKALETEPFWLRFLTEAQMFLSRYQQTVNGVWFWGGSACHAADSRPLVVCGDESEAWHAAARLVSSDVRLYHSDMMIEKNSVCFVPTFSSDILENLGAKLNKHTVNWSWNDTTYMTKPKRFWAKLWGRKP